MRHCDSVSEARPEPHLPSLVIAGPILRRLSPEHLTLWLATIAPVQIELNLFPDDGPSMSFSCDRVGEALTTLKAGERLFFQLIDLPLEQLLPRGCWIGYDLRLAPEPGEGAALEYQDWTHWAPDLVYPGRERPGFVLQPKLTRLLHGSCRKPHHDSDDGLWRADRLLAESDPTDWPGLLMMSGDQVYADDVAAPMLAAIHGLIDRLGIPDESLPCAHVARASELHRARPHYYCRELLLPKSEAGDRVVDLIFGGVRKPVFTSDNAHNHLISLAEMLAMYLLVWSPEGWRETGCPGVDELPRSLHLEQRADYCRELRIVEHFVRGLPRVRRLMAHLPVAMIFDDHDITDDWNLSAAWEQTAYGHPFSRRIIGNALLGYLICQGWGNAPEQIPEALLEQTQQVLLSPGDSAHDELLEQLLRFPHWHYQWHTDPVLIVLDTRTHRWRSELALARPSGLMDWESLTDLQHRLLDHQAVVMVSPAPVFGVKLIEAVQRLFTWAGNPLLVDAENWMAHKGAAYALMNLFRHPRTPEHFVILSGDVHYSFVYDIELRGRRRGPDLWQITSSGLKNEFPQRLLDLFDRLNRWLYSPRSPLNWLTKRRRMRVIPRKPESADPGERLVNGAGIGLVELNPDGSPRRVVQLSADGRDIGFQLHEQDARWE